MVGLIVVWIKAAAEVEAALVIPEVVILKAAVVVVWEENLVMIQGQGVPKEETLAVADWKYVMLRRKTGLRQLAVEKSVVLVAQPACPRLLLLEAQPCLVEAVLSIEKGRS